MLKIIQNNKKYVLKLIYLEFLSLRRSIRGKGLVVIHSSKIDKVKSVSTSVRKDDEGYHSNLSRKPLNLASQLKTIHIGDEQIYSGTWDFEVSENHISIFNQDINFNNERIKQSNQVS